MSFPYAVCARMTLYMSIFWMYIKTHSVPFRILQMSLICWPQCCPGIDTWAGPPEPHSNNQRGDLLDSVHAHPLSVCVSLSLSSSLSLLLSVTSSNFPHAETPCSQKQLWTANLNGPGLQGHAAQNPMKHLLIDSEFVYVCTIYSACT